MSIEKRIADFIMGAFGKAREVEQTVETAVITEVKKIEQFVVREAKSEFEQARQDALSANAEVNKLKSDLQNALSKAANLHQAAVDAANAARQAAEADVEKFKALAAAHAADLATQSNSVTIAPAPVEPDPAPATQEAS